MAPIPMLLELPAQVLGVSLAEVPLPNNPNPAAARATPRNVQVAPLAGLNATANSSLRSSNMQMAALVRAQPSCESQ